MVLKKEKERNILKKYERFLNGGRRLGGGRCG